MKKSPRLNILKNLSATLLLLSGSAWGVSSNYSIATFGNTDGPKASSITASIGGVPNGGNQYKSSDNLTVTAAITVADEDIGTMGSLYVVVFKGLQRFMKNSAGELVAWDGNIDSLMPVQVDDALSETEILDIFRDFSGEPGEYKAYVGYKNSADTLSYNGTPILFTVNSDDKAVLNGYVRIGHAVYQDSLSTALLLKTAVEEFIADPTTQTQAKAKMAWKMARVPYLQSEAYRFGNTVVDDWEGKVNAWPLDEGLIDYVDAGSYINELGNEWAQANIIANNANIVLAGETLDATEITPELLESLHEISGSEANVATGYHAIEFLLWGQDLHGTDAGAGERSYTDYLAGADCTNGNCDRRAAYLLAASDLLVQDLEFIVDQWESDGGLNGENYATEFLADSTENGLRKMLFGIGSLSFGELAGERMKVALIANSTEDEHDCFSDNTHSSYFFDALGIKNVFSGYYRRIDGSVITAPSLAELVATKNPTISSDVLTKMNLSQDAIQKLVDKAEANQAFDQLIAPGNSEGAVLIQAAIDALAAQTVVIETAAETLGITNLNPDTAGHEF